MSVSDRLFRHYDSVDLRRWKRLNECPHWIYLDNFFVFTNWDSTLEAVRFHLESKERDMFDLGAHSPILHQTLELHWDASTTLVLQECIRMHRASLKAFELVLGRLPQPTSLFSIQRRLEDVAELLEFYQSTCVTVLEQQRNLLNMRFNLETIGQSQTVMRLNALAFIFLPLSFIASIFGMTTITTPAVWYIAVALPTLMATVGAVFIINRVTDYLQSRRLEKQQKNQLRSHGVNGNAPRSRLAKNTDTRLSEHTTSNTASLDKALSTSPEPPSQKQLETSTVVLNRQPPGQQQPKSSTGISDENSPGQQQPEPSMGILDRQSPDQQQSETSTLILDGHTQNQQQPKSPTGSFNEQSPGQQQLEPSTHVLNEPSPSQQQLAPSTRIFDFQSQGQQQPPIDVLGRRFKRTIDSYEVNSRPAILGKRKPGDSDNRLPISLEGPYGISRSPWNSHSIFRHHGQGSGNGGNEERSGEAYDYRVTGVARVDSIEN
ncbi:hypothetical protein J3F84DRAFT_82650 [Trichoderma pleuroticola]